MTCCVLQCGRRSVGHVCGAGSPAAADTRPRHRGHIRHDGGAETGASLDGTNRGRHAGSAGWMAGTRTSAGKLDMLVWCIPYFFYIFDHLKIIFFCRSNNWNYGKADRKFRTKYKVNCIPVQILHVPVHVLCSLKSEDAKHI